MLYFRLNIPSFIGYSLRILWRRKRQPTPVFLPGELQGQRSLAGYSPWGCKELDTTDHGAASQHFYVEENAGGRSRISGTTALW